MRLMFASSSVLLVFATLFSTSAPCNEKPAEKRPSIPPKAFYAAAAAMPQRQAAPEDVASWLNEGSAVLLDLRAKEYYHHRHLRGAKSLAGTELTNEALREVVPSTSTRIIVYCDYTLAPIRQVALTTLAAPAIDQLGYHNLYTLKPLWMSPVCQSSRGVDSVQETGCPPFLPMESGFPDTLGAKRWLKRLRLRWLKRLRLF